MNINLTENSYVFQTAKGLAEEALDRCFKRLKENEEKWNEPLNLKLYDAFGMNEFETDFGKIVLNDEFVNNAFLDFCSNSYDMMLEDLKESNDILFEQIRDNIGHTSSFYLGKAHNNEKDKYIVALAELSETFNNCIEAEVLFESKAEEGCFKIHTDNTPEEYFEQCLSDFLNIAENVEKEFEEAFHEIEVVYDYITDFKKNQVEYYKDFVLSWLQTW